MRHIINNKSFQPKDEIFICLLPTNSVPHNQVAALWLGSFTCMNQIYVMGKLDVSSFYVSNFILT